MIEYGRVDIDGSVLLVTDEEVSYRDRSLRTAEVWGIRYGIYKKYINEIRSHRSYKIWLAAGRDEQLEIECAAGFLPSTSTVEGRYEAALKALWPAVTFPILERFLEAFADRREVEIAEVTFDGEGMHTNPRPGWLFKPAPAHLPWSKFAGHKFWEGRICLYREDKRWPVISCSLRDDWNAVLIEPFLDRLF